MPIHIESFEIVTETTDESSTRGGGEGEAQQSAPPPMLRPYEIVEALRLHIERMERVRAD